MSASLMEMLPHDWRIWLEGRERIQEEETPYDSEAHRHIKRVRRPRCEPKKQRAHQIGKKGKKF